MYDSHLPSYLAVTVPNVYSTLTFLVLVIVRRREAIIELQIGILTISDSVAEGRAEDRGGPAIRAALNPTWTAAQTATLPDDRQQISALLREWCGDARLDVIFTTGGTGLGPRDITPEATLDVADRVVPGIAEALRQHGATHLGSAILSRGVAVLRDTTLIINLPGSPNGAREGVDVIRPILEHAVATIHGARH